jgi:hypothetical protein
MLTLGGRNDAERLHTVVTAAGADDEHGANRRESKRDPPPTNR